MKEYQSKSAIISECGQYRYSLSRIWDSKRGKMMFVCLNPSTANANIDDPTIRRCVGFAEQWGYGGFIMTNLFALRSTDPDKLKSHHDPVGPDNNIHILEAKGDIRSKGGIIVAAWGIMGGYLDRDKSVAAMLYPLLCLGKAKNGQPKHPLYLRGDTKPISYK